MERDETSQFESALSELLDLFATNPSGTLLNETHAFLQRYPGNSEGYFLLGLVSYHAGRLGDAEEMFRKAHDIDPEIVEYSTALSCLHSQAGRLNDALYFAKLGAVGASREDLRDQLPLALRNFIDAVQKAGFHHHYVNASIVFHHRQYARALGECELELKIHPDYLPAKVLMGRILLKLGDYGRALTYLLSARDQDGGTGEDVSLLLAEAAWRLGYFEQADQFLTLALERDKPSLDGHARAVLMRAAMEGDAARTNEGVRAFEDRFLGGFEPYFPVSPSRDRKIRVGFLSDKCYSNLDGRALLALVSRMDQKIFESYVYMQNANKDSTTQKLINAAQWCQPVYDVDDKTLSKIMNRDGIDVLFDMCGFDEGGRLALVAHRPASLNFSWPAPPLGGLQPAIDWVVTDGATHAEQARVVPAGRGLFRLKAPLFAIQPIGGFGDPAPAPSLEKGHLTLGMRLDLRDLTPAYLETLRELMDKLPGARLRLHIGQYVSDVLLARLNEVFEPLGVLERIDLHSPDEKERMGGFLDQVDLYLASRMEAPDTVLEALWMGAPCLLFDDGRSSIVSKSRVVLESAGLGRWICRSGGDLVNQALEEVKEPARLEAHRKNLRALVMASPLMNVDAFVMDFQVQLANMFFRTFEPGKEE
ncbi:MAG: tetratricopeptide repeat protein [Alphaproteobacteria bacterium]|nr:tetratricopeptide repeat protein [Alphaproteobacteria bacterium]